MRNSFLCVSILFGGLVTVLPQDHHFPYAGQQHQAIKALSPDEVDAYLNGHGMGLAKAAELNHYPGPKHVLELAAPLNLSEEQRPKTEAEYKAMHEQAVRLGKQIVEKERALNHLFVQESIDAKTLRERLEEIARLQGELRFVHLQAHLKMMEILTKEQREKYDSLRGYKGDHNPAVQHRPGGS